MEMRVGGEQSAQKTPSTATDINYAGITAEIDRGNDRLVARGTDAGHALLEGGSGVGVGG